MDGRWYRGAGLVVLAGCHPPMLVPERSDRVAISEAVLQWVATSSSVRDSRVFQVRNDSSLAMAEVVDRLRALDDRLELADPDPAGYCLTPSGPRTAIVVLELPRRRERTAEQAVVLSAGELAQRFRVRLAWDGTRWQILRLIWEPTT